MKRRIRWVVYSALAMPLIALGIFALSLEPAGRAGFLADWQRNTMHLLSGKVDAASLFSAKPAARDELGGGWRGESDPDPDYDVAAVFARLDKDSDGRLIGNEIGKRLRDHLERLDADKNGGMTLDEFQLGMQTMYSHRDRVAAPRPHRSTKTDQP